LNILNFKIFSKSFDVNLSKFVLILCVFKKWYRKMLQEIKRKK